MRLKDRAFLVTFRCEKQWYPSKQAKQVSDSAARQHGVSADRVTASKVLCKDAPQLKAVMKAVSEYREYVKQESLPWRDDGKRVMRSENFEKFSAGCRSRERDIHVAKSALVGVWDDLVSADRLNLNGLYNPADYPLAAEMLDRWQVGVLVEPVPDAEDFRAGLADDELEQVRATLEAENAATVQAAMADVWRRLYEPVKHLAETLRDDARVKGCHSTLVGNVLEVVDVLKRINLTDDANLESLRAEVAAKLTQYPTEVLKDAPLVRAQVAADAQSIIEKMSAFMA